ncbi:MAG TPA: VOC family protein [Acetobacteraceae bacterium]
MEVIMFNGFDHAILGVNDLPRAEADLRGLGFTVTTRPDVGATDTENRLICFPDGSYIEIFAFRDPAHPGSHRWAPVLAKGDGWLDYSLHVADVNAEAQRLNQAGVATVGPRTGGRALADGRRWGVAVLLAGRGVGSPVLPFLIQDTEARATRVPGGDAARQPGGVAGILGIRVLTSALASVEPGLDVVFGAGTAVAHPGATTARRYVCAGRWVEVIQPANDGTEMAAHLQRRGEGVYEVLLGRPDETGGAEGVLLPTAAMHGARLRLAA